MPRIWPKVILAGRSSGSMRLLRRAGLRMPHESADPCGWQKVDSLWIGAAASYCGSWVWKTDDVAPAGHHQRSRYKDPGERHGHGEQTETDRSRPVSHSLVESRFGWVTHNQALLKGSMHLLRQMRWGLYAVSRCTHYQLPEVCTWTFGFAALNSEFDDVEGARAVNASQLSLLHPACRIDRPYPKGLTKRRLGKIGFLGRRSLHSRSHRRRR